MAHTSCWNHTPACSNLGFISNLKILLPSSYVVCLVAQSWPTLCDPMDCSPPSSSVHGDFSGKNTRVGCHALIQGIFLTQGLNSHLPHCRWILCHLSLVGSPQVPVSTIKFTCFLASVLSTLYLIKQYILSCWLLGIPWWITLYRRIPTLVTEGKKKARAQSK